MNDFVKPIPNPPIVRGKHCILSSTAGIRVSPLVLGGMSLGNAWSSFTGSIDKDQTFQLLDAFVKAGENFIDTANAYQEANQNPGPVNGCVIAAIETKWS